ncbi:DUF6252 family protein [Formosa haliotis]|uniref:DUF6252 family protein n=1 Tax=Formosa haliotis TaxID=1555194 RepID=UPI0011474DE7|nr:DUF6252 family protein [Formosa haliotis]
MKHWFTILLLSVMFMACDDNVEFNYPAFQANKEGVLWKSTTQNANFSGSRLVVNAKLSDEIMTLEIPSATLDTFQLGAGETSVATYTNSMNEFSTAFSGTELIELSDGEIVIDEINTAEGYVSGSFWFTAFDQNNENSVNFNRGVFYKVPITTGQ